MSDAIRKYSGFDWIEKNDRLGGDVLQGEHPSMLGVKFGDFLGDLFLGIYHLDIKWLRRVEWHNPHHVWVTIGQKSWATYDSNLLTRAVVLSHHYLLRIELRPAKKGYLHLWAWERNEFGSISERMPNIHKHVKEIENHYGLVGLPSSATATQNGGAS